MCFGKGNLREPNGKPWPFRRTRRWWIDTWLSGRSGRFAVERGPRQWTIQHRSSRLFQPLGANWFGKSDPNHPAFNAGEKRLASLDPCRSFEIINQNVDLALKFTTLTWTIRICTSSVWTPREICFWVLGRLWVSAYWWILWDINGYHPAGQRFPLNSHGKHCPWSPATAWGLIRFTGTAGVCRTGTAPAVRTSALSGRVLSGRAQIQYLYIIYLEFLR